MKRKINVKMLCISIALILSILFNSSSVFAYSFLKYASKQNVTTSTVTNKETLAKSLSEQKQKLQELKKKMKEDLAERKAERKQIQKITIPNYNIIAKESEKNATVQKNNENTSNNTKSFNINLFNKNSTTVDKKLYTKNLLSSFIPSIDDIEMLTDVLSSIKELNIDKNKIKTAISQLIKAIAYTSSGIPTEEDLNELKEELLSGEFYHLDLDENGEILSDEAEVVYSTIQDMGRFCNYNAMGYERADGRPIAIGKVKLHTIDKVNNKEETIDDVYYVALAGTSFTENQSCGLIADVLSGIESNSPYLKKSKEAILNNIPKGSKIIISGFSLGGMMAQQLVAEEEILTNYDIVQVTVLGCPALCVEERAELFKKYNINIPINRVIDEYDLIPFMSKDYFLNEEPKEIIEKLYKEDHNKNRPYKTFVGTHFIGYLEQDCYKKYDVLGNPIADGKYSTITLKHGDFEYYEVPTQFLKGSFSKIE